MLLHPPLLDGCDGWARWSDVRLHIGKSLFPSQWNYYTKTDPQNLNNNLWVPAGISPLLTFLFFFPQHDTKSLAKQHSSCWHLKQQLQQEVISNKPGLSWLHYVAFYFRLEIGFEFYKTVCHNLLLSRMSPQGHVQAMLKNPNVWSLNVSHFLCAGINSWSTWSTRDAPNPAAPGCSHSFAEPAQKMIPFAMPTRWPENCNKKRKTAKYQ